MLFLRNYQKECVRSVARSLRKGVSKQLIALPTGTGKTVIFLHLIKNTKGRSIILVHRDELLNQAIDKLLTIWPEANVGVVKAARDETDAKVIVASVQTLSRRNRLERISDVDFGCIVTDEAHHSVAATYRRVYDALIRKDRQLHLGVTATPNRADKVGLGEVFTEVTYHKTLLGMIEAGWLCNLRCMRVETKVSLSGVHTRMGDFANNELASVINTINRNDLIVEAYKQYAKGRLALCFTVNVQHAHDLTKAFVDGGVKAIALSGRTPLEERREVLRMFHRREIDVICNCQLLTEGFDEPAIDCIILARPTKSEVLYTQMIGRGTRRFPNKKDCLIIDVADNAGRHSIIQLPDLVGLYGSHKLDGTQTITQLVRQESEISAITDLKGTGIEVSEVDLVSSRLTWLDVGGDRYILELADQGSFRIMPSKQGKYLAIYVSPDKHSRYLSKRAIDLTWALGIAEAEAERVTGGRLTLVRKDAEWRKKPASDKQLALLVKYNIPFEKEITKGEASDAIGCLFAKGRKLPQQPQRSTSLSQMDFLDLLQSRRRHKSIR